MARTYDRQARLYGNSGTHMFEDGDGMHSRIAADAMTDLNNLWGRCAIKVGHVVAPQGTLTVNCQGVAASTELFVGQVPTLVPHGYKRLVYTIGMSTFASGTGPVTSTSAVTLYLSPYPYTGAGPTTAFDTTRLPTGYSSRSTAITLNSTGTSSYSLLDDTSVGMANPPGFYPWGGQDRGAYLICTVTIANVNGSTNNVRFHDVTWWFNPE